MATTGRRASSGETATHEIAATYSHRAAVPPASWWHHLTHADEHIDLLGYAILHLPEQHPQLMELLEDKARVMPRADRTGPPGLPAGPAARRGRAS